MPGQLKAVVVLQVIWSERRCRRLWPVLKVSPDSCEVGLLLLNDTFVSLFCALQTTARPVHVWRSMRDEATVVVGKRKRDALCSRFCCGLRLPPEGEGIFAPAFTPSLDPISKNPSGSSTAIILSVFAGDCSFLAYADCRSQRSRRMSGETAPPL